jgi:hypothetical protein
LQEIFKIRKDGSGSAVKLTDSAYAPFQVVGDCIYYMKYNSSGKHDIWKIKVDGSESTKINLPENKISIIDPEVLIVSGDWIITKGFWNDGNVKKTLFFRVKIDG